MNRAILFGIAGLALAPAMFPDAMFRGNLSHTGVYDSPGVTQFHRVKWTFKTGGWVLSSPAVSEGVVYIGSDDGNVYAINAAAGAAKWKFATEGPIRSSPAVANGTVYFVSYDGNFYAVDAATGKLKWKFATAGERHFEAKGLHGYLPRSQTVPDFWDMFLSSPAVDDAQVYFGSGDGNFYALDALSGQLKWKVATGDVVHGSPALAGGMVYFGSFDSWFYAVDAHTGNLKWRFKTGEDKVNYNQVGLQSSPAVSGGVVYFGGRDSHLYALDAATGSKKWAYDNHGTWIIASPTVHKGMVYAGTSIPGLIRALDATTGQQKFELPARSLVFSSAAIAGDFAYAGAFNGELMAVNLKTGTLAWTFQTPAGKEDALGLSGPDGRTDENRIFLSHYYDDMYRAADKLFSLGSIVSSPAVADGVIYFGSTDKNVYAIE